LAFLCSIAMLSCKKEMILNETNLPEESVDLIYFEDIANFKNHFEEMDQMYDENPDMFDRLAKENSVKTPFQIFIKDKFSDPSEKYTSFLEDPIMSAIVNEHYEFQIGNVLLTYLDNNLILTSDVENKEARKQIRLMPKGEFINFEELPEEVYPVTDDSFEDVLGPWDGTENYSRDDVVQAYKSVMACSVSGSSGYSWYGFFNEAMYYKTSSYKSWGRTREEALLYSYTNMNGQWQINGALISAEIDADRRNDNCSYTNNEDETKSGHNGSIRARVNKWGNQYHNTGDVVGTYYKSGLVTRTQTVTY